MLQQLSGKKIIQITKQQRSQSRALPDGRALRFDSGAIKRA
jgi:hypothetical protein